MCLCREVVWVQKHLQIISIIQVYFSKSKGCAKSQWKIEGGTETLGNRVITGSLGASLVVQWLRIHLPMQGTQVKSLVREDPTCRGTTKPVHHSYWACTLEPTLRNYWVPVLQLLKPTCCRACVLQLLSSRAATTEARAPRAHALQWEAHAPQRRVAPARHN